VGGLLHCWGALIKFSNNCDTETKTINFMVSVDMIVTSMDFKHQDVLHIHEFIWPQKEKKSKIMPKFFIL
jgi:cupin superfamily acireductone dioxygenase involved in methionine salvage